MSHRHVADFVQEEGAAMGLLELADVPRGRAGERSLFVPEQLRFDQLARHRGAVQRDERPVAPRAALVQRARNQLFPRARLAHDADPRFAGRHAVHLRHHAPHGLARVDDGVLAHALPQLAVLVLQPLQLEDVVHGEEKFVRGKRFFEEIDGAQPRGAHRHLDAGLSGNHHHRQRDPQVAQVFEQRQAVLAGHHHVRQQHVERLRLQQLQCARGVIAHGGLVARQAEGPRQGRQGAGVVVDDQKVRQV
jgi:hypothetical protein